MAEIEDSFAQAMQLVLSSALPMTLHATIQLGVLEILGKAGPDAKMSASDIAAQITTTNKDAVSMLDRMLRFLASHNVISCSLIGLDRLYCLNSVSKLFVTDEDGVSLSPLMDLIQDKVFLESWSELKTAVIEGGVPFDRVHGSNTFELPAIDSRFNQVFNKAMYHHTTIVITNILKVYNGFENVKQLVDVGGGVGTTLKAVTAKYPHIKCINFDLPHVLKQAPQIPGVEHVAGDMFESVPRGDAIFMKWILHDWSDQRCLKLLKNCCESIPDDGKVIVVDAILPVLPKSDAATQANSATDLIMLTQDPGGKERSKDELMALATRAGFKGIRFECFVCNFWVMEFYK